MTIPRITCSTPWSEYAGPPANKWTEWAESFTKLQHWVVWRVRWMRKQNVALTFSFYLIRIVPLATIGGLITLLWSIYAVFIDFATESIAVAVGRSGSWVDFRPRNGETSSTDCPGRTDESVVGTEHKSCTILIGIVLRRHERRELRWGRSWLLGSSVRMWRVTPDDRIPNMLLPFRPLDGLGLT